MRKTYKRIFKDGSGKMKLCRGKVHYYLVMNLDYTIKGEVKTTMIPYIKEMIKDFQKYDPSTDKKTNTPAQEFLFKVDDKSRLIDYPRVKVFHTFVAKSLFATKRYRPNIHTAVDFLTTRVRGPNKDDWKKQLILLQYLRNTTDMPLTLHADGINIVKWWVDVSYAVHTDIRSQTGGTILLGKGAIISTSIKQKMNTKSLTETEIIVANDLMPHILWTNYSLNCQGYNAKETIIYQYNKSAILLEKKSKKSISKRKKQIAIQYYFITDRVKADELNIEYCPTGDMVADYFTKPLQSNKFYQFRKEMMNLMD